jgi:DNA repair protein RecN (Recombination protein N)
MLRLLSIRNFAIVEAVDAELDAGFTVLTGETGAGKSILLEALSLLLGDRFESRQLRPGADRAEIAAEFDLSERQGARMARRAVDGRCRLAAVAPRSTRKAGAARGSTAAPRRSPSSRRLANA